MALRTHEYQYDGTTVYDDTEPIRFCLCQINNGLGAWLIAFRFDPNASHKITFSPENEAAFGERHGYAFSKIPNHPLNLLELIALHHKIQTGEEDLTKWKYRV